jgi:putative membrane protein
MMARRIVRDHTTSSKTLHGIARNADLKLPSTLPGAKAAMIAKLRAQQGNAFNRTFAAMQVKAHQQAIALFAAEQRAGASRIVRAFARSELPLLRIHLRMAQQLVQKYR